MAYQEGQKVVCVKDIFPVIATTKLDKSEVGTNAPVHPVKGETLVIDEILGDFFRFSKYDTDAFNWWHSSCFRPLDDIQITMTEEVEESSSIPAGLAIDKHLNEKG